MARGRILIRLTLILGLVVPWQVTPCVAKCVDDQDNCRKIYAGAMGNPMSGSGLDQALQESQDDIDGPPFKGKEDVTFEDFGDDAASNAERAVLFNVAGAAGGLHQDHDSIYPQRVLLSTNELGNGEYSDRADQLWMLNPLDESLNRLGRVFDDSGLPLSMVGLALSDQTLFAWVRNGTPSADGLYKIDPFSLTGFRVLPAPPGSDIYGIDADPNSGIIFLANNAPDQRGIFSLDPNNPAASLMFVDNYPSNVNHVDGVAVQNEGVFLFGDGDDDQVHVYDLRQQAYDPIAFQSPFKSDGEQAGAAFADFGSSLDLDGDGRLDPGDLDELITAIHTPGSPAFRFDLNGDGEIDSKDMTQWLADVGSLQNASGGSHLIGDANLDGFVDVSDRNLWNANKFTDNAGWSGGDFNGDGFTDVSDLNLWSTHKFMIADEVAAVPEPATPMLLIAILFPGIVSLRNRRRSLHVG